MPTWWGEKGTADGQVSRGHDKIASGLFEFRKDSPVGPSSRQVIPQLPVWQWEFVPKIAQIL